MVYNVKEQIFRVFIVVRLLMKLWNLKMQEGWCDSKGTIDDVKAKIQMRQEGAFKRERAIAYSLAQKVLSINEA